MLNRMHNGSLKAKFFAEGSNSEQNKVYIYIYIFLTNNEKNIVICEFY